MFSLRYVRRKGAGVTESPSTGIKILIFLLFAFFALKPPTLSLISSCLTCIKILKLPKLSRYFKGDNYCERMPISISDFAPEQNSGSNMQIINIHELKCKNCRSRCSRVKMSIRAKFTKELHSSLAEMAREFQAFLFLHVSLSRSTLSLCNPSPVLGERPIKKELKQWRRSRSPPPRVSSLESAAR